MEELDAIFNAVFDSPNSENDWTLLAPCGEFAASATAPGSNNWVSLVVRIDKDSVNSVIHEWKSPLAKAGRFLRLRDCPVLLGHGDHPVLKGTPGCTDTTPKGQVLELDNANGALMGRLAYNEDGLAALDSANLKLYPSVRWMLKPTGEKTANGVDVYVPTRLRSVGLVTTPNFKVDSVNSSDVKIPQIIEALRKAGFDVQDSASENQILALIGASVPKAAVDSANQRISVELTTAKTDLESANARLIEIELEMAKHRGQLSVADFATWRPRLAKAYATESVALRALKPTYSVSSAVDSTNSRAFSGLDSSAAQLKAAAQAIYERDEGRFRDPTGAWGRAFVQAQAQNPALVAALNQAQ